MGYRGEDLDLRTPQGGNAPNWWTRSTIYAGGRADPIWVDDVVLACVNRAFDLASAHRAGEVKLEHVLHALTLDEVSAGLLEHRGIRTAGLRRETAAAIAELAPTLNGKGPRKSEEVEEVLRYAADRAYPRGTPVTVDDLLHVMFELKRDVPGFALLHRYGGNWTPRDERADMRLEPLPHLAQRQTEFRFPANDEMRARAAQAYFGDTRETRDTREPRGPQREVPAAYPVGGADMQNGNRLEGLERAFKDLSTDISDERKTFQSFLTDLKRNAALQDDAMRIQGGISDRLKSVEEMLQRSRQDTALVPGAVSDRLSGIEQTLEAVERAFSALIERIAGIERQLLGAGQSKPIDLTPVEERIATFERSLLSRVPQPTDLASVTELLSGIETRADDTVRGTTEIGERLVRLERALENRTAETGRTVSFVGERLRAFEEQLATQKLQSERIETLLTEKLGAIERLVGEQLQSIAGVAKSGTEEVGRVNTALETVTSNQRMLASAFDQWRLDAGGDLGIIDNRVQLLEATAKGLQPQLETLASQVAVVHAIMAKREKNKSYLRNWLFGTDDWYRASWDTSNWRQAQTAVDEADARLERTRPKPTSSVPVRR